MWQANRTIRYKNWDNIKIEIAVIPVVHVCRSSISSHHYSCCYLLHFPWLLQSCRWRPQQLELWQPDDSFCRCCCYSLTVAGISGEKALHTPICSNWSVCLISGRHTSLDKTNSAADSSLNFSVWKFFPLWKLECSCSNLDWCIRVVKDILRHLSNGDVTPIYQKDSLLNLTVLLVSADSHMFVFADRRKLTEDH